MRKASVALGLLLKFSFKGFFSGEGQSEKPHLLSRWNVRSSVRYGSAVLIGNCGILGQYQQWPQCHSNRSTCGHSWQLHCAEGY